MADGAIFAAGSVFVEDHNTWVARLSLTGAVEWEDIVDSGFGDDYLIQIVATADGNLVVTGLASIEGDETALWTRKYRPDKTANWTATLPLTTKSNIFPLGPGLVATPDSVVAGWRMPNPDNANLLVAYPLGGSEPLWQLTLPGTFGGIMAIARDPGGELTLATSQDELMTVRRTTSDGNLLWAKQDCTGRNGRDIAIDSQGDIVVIGDGPGNKDGNIRLCKFAADGQLRWGKDIDGGFGNDLGYAVAIGPMDRIVAGGSMRSEQGNDDVWLAVFTP